MYCSSNPIELLLQLNVAAPIPPPMAAPTAKYGSSRTERTQLMKRSSSSNDRQRLLLLIHHHPLLRLQHWVVYQEQVLHIGCHCLNVLVHLGLLCLVPLLRHRCFFQFLYVAFVCDQQHHCSSSVPITEL